jgi:hypothetical protein
MPVADSRAEVSSLKEFAMARNLFSLLTAALVLSTGAPMSGNTTFKSAYHDYRVVTVVDALVQPWSIAFLPGGDTLITDSSPNGPDVCASCGKASCSRSRLKACRKSSTRDRVGCSRWPRTRTSPRTGSCI